MSTHTIAFAAEKVRGGVLMADSRDEKAQVKTLPDAISFLLEDYDIPERKLKYIKVAWDLEALAAALFSLLPASTHDRLVKGGRYREGPFSVFHVPYKMLGVSYGQYNANIYNLRQYYPQNGTVVSVKEAEDYGEKLLIELQKLNLYPTKLTSPAAIYEECVLAHMSVPTIYDMADKDYDAADYAYRIAGREWRQAFNESAKKTWKYDLRAAYPSIAATLLDTRRAEFIYSNRDVPDGVQWGFMSGRVVLDATKHPIIDENGLSEAKSRDDIIALEQAATIKRWGLGSFTMNDGWFLRFSNKCRPLETTMKRLFNQRGGNELREFLAKHMANASLGKFLEEHDDGKYGRFFNPIYSAIITSTIPCKVCDFIYSHGLANDLVGVQVDGVESNRFVEIPSKQEMGTWRIKETD